MGGMNIFILPESLGHLGINYITVDLWEIGLEGAGWIDSTGSR
jgi:hypothetical protein